MTSTRPASRLEVEVAGLTLQNPVLLASGTAGYGRELADVMRLDALGGLVTKAVSLEPRSGAPSPASASAFIVRLVVTQVLLAPVSGAS